MKSGVAFVLGLIGGCGIGIAGATFLIKDKLERKAEEEILSVKESFRQARANLDDEKKKEEELKKNADEAVKVYKGETEVKKAEEPHEKRKPKPYIISSEQFAEAVDRSTETLRFYGIGGAVVTDDEDRPLTMEEIVRTIGRDAVTHFGDDEDDPDTVYVRNEENGIDYEIQLMGRSYSDVVKEKPHLKAFLQK